MRLSRSRAIALGASALVGTPRRSRAATAQVKVAIAGTFAEAPLYIAEAKGYYREQDLAIEYIPIASGAQMVAPLGTDQIDIGAGAPSAGLYNAIGRGIGIRIVADRSQNSPGYGFTTLLVRKQLVDEGRVRTLKDLKGLRVAEVAKGTVSFCTLVAALKAGGLTYQDVQEIFLNFPDQFVAFQNGAIDAAITVEPIVTKAVAAGIAVRFGSVDRLYPHQEIGTILYSAQFIRERRELGQRFMVAYIKAVRDYYAALKDGHLTGPGAGEVLDTLIKYTDIKDRALYQAVTPSWIDPNARVNLPSLQRDFQTFKEANMIIGRVTLEDAVDQSVVEGALKVAGLYKRR